MAVKATAVTFFNQAVRSFVTPYGAAAEAPEPTNIYRRLKPFTCEWLSRPHIALSEYADTIVSNLKILEKKDSGNVVQPHILKTLQEHFTPIMSNLNAVNNKMESSATITDVKEVLRSVVKDNDQIDDLMEQMFHMSNAMFTMSCNYLITTSLLRHPQQFSKLVETLDVASRAFKSKGTVQTMKGFLLNNFKGTRASVSRKASKDVQDALDSCNESSSSSSSSSCSSSDEDSKEQRRKNKKSRKRKHAKRSQKKTRKPSQKRKLIESDDTASLLRHPQQFSELVETDVASRAFKSKGTVQTMKGFLLKNFKGTRASVSRKAFKDVQDALDSCNESSSSSSSCCSSSDEDSKEQRRKNKKSRKRKHAKRSQETEKTVVPLDSKPEAKKSPKKKGTKTKDNEKEQCGNTPKRKREKKKPKKRVLELFDEDE